MTVKATPTRVSPRKRFADVVNVCPDCNHDVVLGEEFDHERCDVNVTALVEEGLAERADLAVTEDEGKEVVPYAA